MALPQRGRFGALARRALAGIGMAAILAGGGLPAHGEALEIRTAYADGTRAAEVAESIAAEMAARTGGALEFKVALAGESHMAAFQGVTDGRAALALTYAPALQYLDPFFRLSALPFLAETVGEARLLYEIARSAYDEKLARHNQKLLMAIPWRPAALWSKKPLLTPGDLAGLKIEVAQRNGGKLDMSSLERFGADLVALNGDAVTSVGHAGNLERYGRTFPYFMEIYYAVQTDLLSVNRHLWDRLEPAQRQALIAVAAEAEERQWRYIAENLLPQDHWDMRANGIAVDIRAPEALQLAFRAAAAAEMETWVGDTGAAGYKIIREYRRRIRR